MGHTSVRTAVFPIAGTTRWVEEQDATAPYSELRPIVDKPVIRFAIDEARRAGVVRFIFITSAEKFFLESQVDAIWQEVKKETAAAGFSAPLEAIFLRQSRRRGIGDALLTAQEHLAGHDFAVIIPNLLILGEEAGLKRMAAAYESGTILIGSTERPRDKLHKFGVLHFQNGPGSPVQMVQEKPGGHDDETAPAAFGRWIFPHQFMARIERAGANADGETSLTEAINDSIGSIPVMAIPVSGLCFDLRQPDGFVQATVAHAMQRPELSAAINDAQRSFLDAGVNTMRSAAWSQRYKDLTPLALIAQLAERDFKDRIALVSSFGADSVVLLHMLSRVSPDIPVLFIETGKLFPETLAYQQTLVEHLGLKRLRFVRPDRVSLHSLDPQGELHRFNPDACCHIRKTLPLKTALAPYDVWITGRKRYQSATRSALGLFEEDEDGRLKVNPLIEWTREDLAAYIRRSDLPEHPLKAQNYPSVGCAPCTTPVSAGEEERQGRWRGSQKAECGIHLVDGRLTRMVADR